NTDDIKSMVFTSLFIAIISGFIVMFIGVGLAKPLLQLIDTPENVIPHASKYLKIYFLGMPFILLYNFGSAILRSAGDSFRPLIALTISGVINVGLNFLFVAVARMNVAGVALATLLSNVISAGMVIYFIFKNEMFRFKLKEVKIRAKYVMDIFKIGIPAGGQGVIFSIANVIIQSTINSFGEKAMAGSGDALFFEMFIYFFTNAFAQTLITFTSQNYAAKRIDRCKSIYKKTLLIAMIITTTLSVSFALSGKYLLRIYTQDEEVLAFGVQRMYAVCMFQMFGCLYELPGGVLRGLGHSLLPAILTIFGSCVLRIIYIFGIYNIFLPQRLDILLIIYPISWLLTGIMMETSKIIISRKMYSNIADDVELYKENTKS
ncbi:MAG: MATE family efflux transporter, partial [Clostridia bacterium]|nr:MATE family efflux transporter [Clostridia bacterium]